MHVVFLYGPPAVGKLTVGKALQEKIGYKLLHNHMLIQIFEDIFPFHHPARRILVREFRSRIIEEAVKHETSLIITSGSAGSKSLFTYYKSIMDMVKKGGGEMHLVHLIADDKTLLERVEHASRREHGKNFGRNEMQEMLTKYDYLFDKYPDVDHLTIDTRENSPEESAQKIIDYYHLT